MLRLLLRLLDLDLAGDPEADLDRETLLDFPDLDPLPDLDLAGLREPDFDLGDPDLDLADPEEADLDLDLAVPESEPECDPDLDLELDFESSL